MSRRTWTIALIAAAMALFTAAPAGASSFQEAQFQDDSLLVYPPPTEVAGTLNTLQALGVDRIRVSIYWRLVAPNPTSTQRPSNFNAADPAAYPAINWRRYDDLLRLAYQRGIAVNFNLDGPAPDWATQGSPAPGITRPVNYPSAAEYGAFVKAVGTRYSGVYEPPNPNPPPPTTSSSTQSNGGGNNNSNNGSNNGGIITLPLPKSFGDNASAVRTPARTAAASDILPRVSFWSIWNEPNQTVFLGPQYSGQREASPRIYRALADAAYESLLNTGHGTDIVLIGETAPKGGFLRDPAVTMRPLRFIRALYCVSPRLYPQGGVTAQLNGCPTSNQAATFKAQHPVLFNATGFAHHPYTLLTPPFIRSRFPDEVGTSDLFLLTRTLDYIFIHYHSPRRLPIYNTEYGYQTRPPDPFGFPPTLAAAYINQAEYMTYVNPRVRSYHQFLLKDAGPLTDFPANSAPYWSTFQTGLIGLNNAPKLSFGAFRMPIFVVGARRTRGGTFHVWGGVRQAGNGATIRVLVQYRTLYPRSSRFHTVRTVTTRATRNYINAYPRLFRSGYVRLAWRNPLTGRYAYSRVAPITIAPLRRR